ncbi:MAG: hypothetical protein IKA40_00455 [Clostridia bacterium]|nr:hypothetical protein [Clostridia bacterium]
MRLNGLKRFMATLAATAVAVAALLGARCFSVCRLSRLDGERTFYLYSASSQALCKKTLSFTDVFYIQGESVRFSWKKQGFGDSISTAITGSQTALAEEIADYFGAEILFIERTNGVLLAYCHSGQMQGGVQLQGKWVNLHIALRGQTCAVGTPLIFDGF